jgi:predicted lipoprotein with Yx(FWY)xxD motif
MREDGIKQYAYRGRLLYRFAGDTAPGEVNGVHAGADWSIARP